MKTKTCNHCQAGYCPKDARQIYCSKSCKVSACVARHPGRYVYARKVSAVRFAYCVHCGCAFMGNGNACSAKCSRDHWLLAAHREAARVLCCEECTLTFCPLYGHGHTRLCNTCRDGLATEQRRTARLRRKALQRAASVESVSPRKVFERCAWTCCNCRMPTPQHLRGTLDPQAPELDHIHPLSKGGAHSYANTQLLCRLCNSLKSDKLTAIGEGTG